MPEQIDILLVDDRPDNFTVLEAVLDAPNYNLVFATSGFEATRAAAQTQFALILMDVQMPGKDGFETAKEIRKQGASKDTPIIFVTAIYGDEAYVNLGYDAGAVDYIFKPFNPYILKSKVAVLADLFVKTRQVLRQNERLRDVEKREHASKLLELQIQGIQREHALQQKYKDLVDSINHCIIWSAHSENLNFSFVSPQAEELLGYKIAAWTNESEFWRKIVHPEDVETVRSSFQKAQKGHDLELEHRFLTKDGRTLWFHTGVHLAEQAEGYGHELRGLSVDITSLKEAEITLRESEEAQRFLAEAGAQLAASALDYSKVAEKVVELAVPKFGAWCRVHLIDENGKINTVASSRENPERAGLISEFESHYQVAAPPIQGMNSVVQTGKLELISFENDNSHLKFLASALELKSFLCVPMLTRHQTLGIITLGSTKKLLQKKDLEIIKEVARRAALAIENAILYNKAENAIRTRDEFLSIASHELRTPLTPLKMQFQIAAKLINDGKFDVLTPEKLQKMMRMSDRQLDRLNDLIEELLNVSRINLGRMSIDRERMDLTQLIRSVTEQYKGQLAASAYELSLNLAPSIEGEWDPHKLEQVIVNLLTNSIKYGRGKPIEIVAEDKGDMARICIKDHGIGIDADAQEKIFNLFERAPSAKNYGGMGLGLYVVRSIVTQHAGTIQVESKLGEGTTFIIELPKKSQSASLSNKPHKMQNPLNQFSYIH